MFYILGGTLKGRSLLSPKGHLHRPTSSLLRKTVFDILQPYTEGCSFLDLCAGTGAMGFEAISRGASFATFVDKSHIAVKTIKENGEALGISPQIKTYCADVLVALERFISQNLSFDIIYFDPPYDLPLYLPVLEKLGSSSLLQKDGLLLVEERYPPKVPAEAGNLIIKKTRRVSSSALHEFIKQPAT